MFAEAAKRQTVEARLGTWRIFTLIAWFNSSAEPTTDEETRYFATDWPVSDEVLRLGLVLPGSPDFGWPRSLTTAMTRYSTIRSIALRLHSDGGDLWLPLTRHDTC